MSVCIELLCDCILFIYLYYPCRNTMGSSEHGSESPSNKISDDKQESIKTMSCIDRNLDSPAGTVKEEEKQKTMSMVQQEDMKETIDNNATSEHESDLYDEKIDSKKPNEIDNNDVEILCSLPHLEANDLKTSRHNKLKKAHI